MIVGVCASAVAAYFYVRVIVLLFFTDPPEDGPPTVVVPSALSMATVTLSAAITLALGALPQPILDLVNSANHFVG